MNGFFIHAIVYMYYRNNEKHPLFVKYCNCSAVYIVMDFSQILNLLSNPLKLLFK